MNALRDALRRNTRPAHDRLDGLWDGHDLTDRRVYIAFLRAIAGALVPLECALSQGGVSALMPDWDRRKRGGAITADLSGLGSALPLLRQAPVVCGVEMLALLYVLEGSRLGGALIGRTVATSADPCVRDNRSFLLHGQCAGLWRSFLERLERASPSASELDAICARASHAFAMFEQSAKRELAAITEIRSPMP